MKAFLAACALVALVPPFAGDSRPSAQQQAAPAAADHQLADAPAEPNSVIATACVRCHSDARMRGNLSLERFDVSAAGDHADVAEKMIRIKWMSLNRLERLREAEARSGRDLPLQQYAALLCEAIRDYDFPAVTYDFTEEKELHHDSMLAVEQYIGALLRSKDLSAVKDGLSNVLY